MVGLPHPRRHEILLDQLALTPAELRKAPDKWAFSRCLGQRDQRGGPVTRLVIGLLADGLRADELLARELRADELRADELLAYDRAMLGPERPEPVLVRILLPVRLKRAGPALPGTASS